LTNPAQISDYIAGVPKMTTFYRRLPRFNYLAPVSLNEALSLLARYKGKAKVIAGGTDIIPKLKRREIRAPEHVIDLKAIPGLDNIQYDVSGLSLGALVTIGAVETSAIIQEKFGVLAQAARSMASPQVRNRGTIAGNICNAVPSADSAPPLLTIGAKLKLVSQEGERVVGIEDFFTGPGQTALANDEILQEIQIPHPPPNSQGIYLKLTPRRAMDLAIVGVAVVIIPQDGICKDIRIALGAVAPTPIRARRAEAVLKGQKLDDNLIEKAARTAAGEARPIDDHRASAEYRRDMVEVLVRRAIKQAIGSRS
jgi:carbon-monoxide dehydrogenase medium subunit